MNKIHRLFSAILLSLTVASFGGCDSEGNSQSGHGTFILATTMTDSIQVYVNYDVAQDLDSTVYASPFTVNGCRLSHYVQKRKFIGGITLSNAAASTSLENNNYSSVPGHGAAAIAGTDRRNQTYFVADLSRPATIYFQSSVPVKPEQIYVTNAALTYHTMLQGTAETPAFTANDRLTLHISGLNEKGETTGRATSIRLANGTDFITEWERLDLTPLGYAYGLQFELEQNGRYSNNMTLPVRFCFDYLVATYEYAYDF